ncbi:DUF3662 domain-containing protein [Streptomyces sp. NPDC046925]|uniref:DUF3662 domain-containing protein n=1 Tax=Streptomyces sp. NPDC046925 TaxID=3155375 RepID=UPI0033EA2155
MQLINRIEHTMERWTTALWTQLVPPVHRHGEVVDILRRQCDDSALILGRERVLVPNSFVVELPPESHRRLSSTSTELGHYLANQVHRHAAEQGYTFAGPVAVSLRSAGEDAVGRFRIHGRITPQSDGRITPQSAGSQYM